MKHYFSLLSIKHEKVICENEVFFMMLRNSRFPNPASDLIELLSMDSRNR